MSTKHTREKEDMVGLFAHPHSPSRIAPWKRSKHNKRRRRAWPSGRHPQNAMTGPQHTTLRRCQASSLRSRKQATFETCSLGGEKARSARGRAESLRKGNRRLRPGLPSVGAEPQAQGGLPPVRSPASLPGTTGPEPAAPALGGGVLPQPPSFPGEEQRIAQASGSGGGGGRKGERRKRDLNERR
ncbi:unnamed protein product [Rangifer tarandus platyrhynchus]|uniref:Uncharacterized protein n=2 Tax=Rangifer tarandus platyrhynchus TaxID=3082113 RepID=A0ACB0E7F7_RANTA|nr:unnamed protein product [Rangifer tarandus platyrhynchus]CAI9696470.1 unnamed protein product [Rangifer tarandus platyrhynchus]